jgi:hypothetical protein
MRVLNLKTHPKFIRSLGDQAVYVGRPSIWGNPFAMRKESERDAVCDQFADYYFASDDLQNRINDLRGKYLVCYCAPRRCHADLLLKEANR